MKIKFQPRKQGGFINGMLMIGIALLAVVVGAIAMASSGANTDISTQKTKTTASVGLKRMADAVEAFQISAADVGIAAAEAAVVVPAMPKGFQSSTTDPVIYAAKHFEVPNVDADVCAAVNKTLGVDAAPATVAALGTAKEACTGDNVYVRVVRD
ncbi:hypothetical protein [Methylibium petroleiphilum]|uniref:Uncharacterized protein n=1 Tax=Methylibium petroleiphilum (strain ATCC BAA-1232 / LMG 22953 / PM1) TaxID=420662 RepID=A2SNP2_METPP|nr:hypothetical protein [Methylibium petroleiphilum]ABM97181.1 hypothetical protein Mpe_B0406 [Methylibium petroleiphilum PM1]